MNLKKVIPLILLTSGTLQAATLSEIADFASRQCEEIHSSGKVSKSQITAKLKGQGKALVKLIGGSVSADGSYKLDSVEYDGVPYEQLASQLTDVRSCKQRLTELILEKATLEEKKTELSFSKEHINYERTNPTNSSWVAEVEADYVQISGHSNQLIEDRINAQLKSAARVDVEYEQQNWFVTTEKYALKGDLLSVIYKGTYYAHGAGGAGNVIESANINIKTGGQIYFKDLFIAGYKPGVDQIAETTLKSQGYGEYFDGLKDDQCYYFDGKYLTLCFDEYEVASGAAGSVEVNIPLDDLRQYISLNGPLAHAL